MERPQIAIAVILENAGWGVKAAPIARQLSDFYLLKVKTGRLEKDVKGAQLTANPLLFNEESAASAASAVSAPAEAPYAALARRRREQSASQPHAPAAGSEPTP